MAGCLAGGFAKGFGYLDDGLLAGLVHDLGKYSDAFQRRIRNPDHCGPVDHSTAGALLLMRHACPLAAMAVAGHHAGLPDLGSYGELEGPTFMSRMNRARRAGDCNPLALAQAGEAQLDIPQSAFLHGTRSAKPMTSSKRSERWSLYTDMMLTRMLFSALVDADRLDAEFFTSNRIDRAEHHILESLKNSKIRNDSTKPTRTTTNREGTMTDRKPIENRYDFTILFDVKDGNPNGDPDSGNMPRVDIETGNGLTTDVCIKRKIRDYVQTAMGEQAPWRIYIQNRQTLNRLDSEALKAEHIDTSLESKDFAKEIKALKKTDPELDRRLRDYMCDQFFDIRTFGAVMTTFVKGSLSCGQVRGPVQLGFARSIDPISVQEISITRIAVTTEADAAEKNNTMGNKFIIPYGLYRMNGYISAKLAQNVTGFCDEDLDVLWQAILNMFEFDRSAARGNMAVRKLYVFKHSSALGDAPSWKLFDSINVHKRAEVDAPRDFADYEVRVNREAIPESVSLTEMVDHAL